MEKKKKNNGKKKPTNKTSWKRKLIFILSIFTLCSMIVGFAMHQHYKKQLPEIKKVSDYKPFQGTKIYSYDGQLIAEFDLNNRRNIIPYDLIPEKFKHAFIAAEDKYFFSHWGMNPIATIKAALGVLVGKKVRGASTISQQLCKPFVGRENKLSRKIKEAIFAVEFLEKHLSKEEILYLYLNQIYLGSNSYGVETASRKYFSKHAWELNLSEMATIAGLPPAPSKYSPIRSIKKATVRRNYVLKRMLDDGYISQKEYKEAKDSKIKLNIQKELSLDKAPYFTEKVRRYLLNKYGYDRLHKEGLTVYTTVDMRATRLAHEAMFYGIRQVSKRQGYRRSAEDSYKKGKKFKGEVTNPLYHIDLKKDLKTYLELHEKEFGKITPENITRGIFYQGVVLETNKKNALVQVGTVKRKILREDLQWAKNFTLLGGWGAINHTDQVFKIGDVIMVHPTDRKGTQSAFNFRDHETPLPKDFYFALESIPASQGAIIVKDPYSGYIKAIMGGYDFEISEFDRTVQACRQPGSAIKPIFYSQALEFRIKDGKREPYFTPASIILDAPVTVVDTNFKPSNSSNTFLGEVTFWMALVKSMNTPSIRILQEIGLGEAIRGAKKLGIKSVMRPEFGSVLGASCLTVDELTDAYAHFANRGKSPHTTYIRKVYDRDGKILEDNTVFYDPYLSGAEKINRLLSFSTRKEEQKISPETSYIITKVLEDVVNHGTGIGASEINYKMKKHISGKTGTTNDNFDAWFIGYNPNIVAGVWVGNDEHGKTLGPSEHGSKAALPIWADFMKRYLEHYPYVNFERPGGVVRARVNKKTGFLDNEKGINMYFHLGTAPTKTKEENSVLDPSKGMEDIL